MAVNNVALGYVENYCVICSTGFVGKEVVENGGQYGLIIIQCHKEVNYDSPPNPAFLYQWQGTGVIFDHLQVFNGGDTCT